MTNEKDEQVFAYSRYNCPVLGSVFDYIETSMEYFTKQCFNEGEKLIPQQNSKTNSTLFLATVTYLLGMLSVIKFEVVTLDGDPLSNDLHFIIMSKEDEIYVEDIDLNRIRLWIETSDFLAILVSCFLIWKSSVVTHKIREYLYLPWLGATIRGLLARQTPTVSALLYTMTIANEPLNSLFITAFIFLFIMEARMWLEVARLVYTRWSLRDNVVDTVSLQTDENMPEKESFEVNNIFY